MDLALVLGEPRKIWSLCMCVDLFCCFHLIDHELGLMFCNNKILVSYFLKESSFHPR